MVIPNLCMRISHHFKFPTCVHGLQLTVQGVPLEDVPLGQNAHWEARLLGPDVMSYGIGSGESYVSSLTLKFFNDTNQCVS